MPAARRPVAGSPASCPRVPPRTSGSRCSSRPPRWRCGPTTDAASAFSPGAATAPSCPLLARATVLATGGMAALWERTTNPAGAVGAGLGLAEVAGARLADLEFMQFHPTALRTGGSRDGFLITEAVRGEGAKLLDADRRALRGRAGPARSRWRSRSRRSWRAAASGRCGSTSGTSTSDAFPTSPPCSPRWASTRPASRCPWPLPPTTRWAVWPPTSTGARHAAGSLRGGRERLQRVARSQPAGLQLPRRVLRLRPARRGGGHSRAPPAAAPGPAPAPGQPGLPPESTRSALWRHAGLQRDAAGLEELARDPFPLARLIAAACLARAESRGAHQRTDYPATDPRLDRKHALVGGALEPAFETWE